MFDQIKKAALGAMYASSPVNIEFGVVNSVNPLEVSIDQRKTFTKEFFVIPESLTTYELDLSHSHSYSQGSTGNALTKPVIVRRGLEKGDKLILLRMQGGQQYVILDRLVSP